ncbi:Scr1 family TA system antitoxin-like transcriptional regulator [Streptomyces halstedii]|uniref:Scr1 family TA system antitoxin-like transcriptional regulator n=1 Tax=Streptomyces halstedii TaxID=1944 RepID=UPI0033B92972
MLGTPRRTVPTTRSGTRQGARARRCRSSGDADSEGQQDGQRGEDAEVHPLVVLHFPDRAVLKPIVYLENLADAWVTRREDNVERYNEAFTDLSALAPGHRESLSTIQTAIKEL